MADPNALEMLTRPLSTEACRSHPFRRPHCWHRPQLQHDLAKYEYLTCCWCSESQALQHGPYRVEER